jgi:hypothetical protein
MSLLSVDSAIACGKASGENTLSVGALAAALALLISSAKYRLTLRSDSPSLQQLAEHALRRAASDFLMHVKQLRQSQTSRRFGQATQQSLFNRRFSGGAIFKIAPILRQNRAKLLPNISSNVP